MMETHEYFATNLGAPGRSTGNRNAVLEPREPMPTLFQGFLGILDGLSMVWEARRLGLGAKSRRKKKNSAGRNKKKW
jgi:hypothetical protein